MVFSFVHFIVVPCVCITYEKRQQKEDSLPLRGLGGRQTCKQLQYNMHIVVTETPPARWEGSIGEGLSGLGVAGLGVPGGLE